MAELASDDPTSIGGYRLLSRLGTGGMGRVYLARSGGGRTVAVKLVKDELAAQPEFRDRFRREVEAAGRVGDRWTAPVLDADTEAPTPWVATGYIAGPSLDQVISAARGGNGPLPTHSLRVLTYGLASALLDIHGAGLVHRDLKPSNVLLTIDGPRVIDFGIARALDAVPESTLTTTGLVVGSPSFMSPEQVTGGQVTGASDVFCLGAVLAYAATGAPPFGGGNAGQMHSTMFRIASEEPDLEGIEEPLLSLVSDCLAKDPAARPAPEDVVARVQPVSLGPSAPPWLPTALIAELGRQAVQLLDQDTPPAGSGIQQPVRTANTPSDPEGLTSQLPAPGATAVYAPDTGQDPAPAPSPPPSTRRTRGRRIAVGLVAAVLIGGAGFAAAGAELPFGSGKKGGGSDSGDVPSAFLGTWTGAVEQDGEPTGQYRKFVITKGEKGEVVANSVSLGTTYECKSDGKLDSVSPSGDSLTLDTKVVRSVPEGRCSAIGEHTLAKAGSGSLEWRAAGRTATLSKVKEAETLPAEVVGVWQRTLPGGGHQRLVVRAEDARGQGLRMVTEGSEHCEAAVGVFSPGGHGQPVRLGPPDTDEATSEGACDAGQTSTLRRDGDELVRRFADGSESRYARSEASLRQ